jgi:hypothetical protein
MVSSLVRLHFLQQGWYYGSVDKPNIPIFVGVGADSHIQRLCNFVYDFVLGVQNVDYQWLLSH